MRETSVPTLPWASSGHAMNGCPTLSNTNLRYQETLDCQWPGARWMHFCPRSLIELAWHFMTTTARPWLGNSVTGQTVCPPATHAAQFRLPDYNRSADSESDSDSGWQWWWPDLDPGPGVAVAFMVTVQSRRSVTLVGRLGARVRRGLQPSENFTQACPGTVSARDHWQAGREALWPGGPALLRVTAGVTVLNATFGGTHGLTAPGLYWFKFTFVWATRSESAKPSPSRSRRLGCAPEPGPGAMIWSWAAAIGTWLDLEPSLRHRTTWPAGTRPVARTPPADRLGVLIALTEFKS